MYRIRFINMFGIFLGVSFCDLLSDFMFLSSEILGYNDLKKLDDLDPWKDTKLYSKIGLEKIFQVFVSHVLGVWLEVCKEFAMCITN